MARSTVFRPSLEPLEDRITPLSQTTIFDPLFHGGQLLVAPPADTVPAQTGDVSHQVANATLPTGDAFPPHGVRLADTHTPVLTWTPT
jgi:hypothetical protein